MKDDTMQPLRMMYKRTQYTCENTNVISYQYVKNNSDCIWSRLISISFFSSIVNTYFLY